MAIRQGSAGRIQPIEYGNLMQPGQCVLCNRIGHTNDELFATLNVELEFYGLVYLCQDCCFEVADFVGCVRQERHEETINKLRVLGNLVKDLDNQVQYLRGILDARISAAGSGVASDGGTYGVPLPKAEFDSDYVNSILNGNQPKSD